MAQKVIIYDATLLVDAYETQLFRTGLYRVCAELLKQLMRCAEYDLWLIDIKGRERLLHRACENTEFSNLSIIQTDSAVYKRFTYKILNRADDLRKKERESKGLLQYWYRFRKALRLRWGQLMQKCIKPVDIILPVTASHYISSYYPIPQWVHKKGLKATLILHDLIPLRHPEWFPSGQNEILLREVIDSVSEHDRVVCVSEATKSDFVYYKPEFPQEHIFVAYEAAANVFRPVVLSASLKQRLKITEYQYFLSVCTLERRKNLITVVQAYNLLLGRECDVPKLVLTGAKGWKNGKLFDEIEEINEQYGNKIVVSGYVTDDELAELYSNCTAFIYPSLYEGFGLPPLEAMQCGAPVITSNVSSLPEVVGDAGILVNPIDVEELSMAMNLLWNNVDKCDLLRNKGIKRASNFSWNEFAQVVRKNLDL